MSKEDAVENHQPFKNRSDKLHIIILSGLIIALLSVIWCYRFLPLQDYPDWLLQGNIFHNILTGNANPGYSLDLNPIPNNISTLFIGIANFLFNPEVSGKIFLSVYIVSFILAGIYFYKSFAKPDTVFQYLPFIIVFGTPFFRGHINWCFSLVFLLIIVAYLRNRYDNPREINTVLLGALLLLLYFSHLANFLICVLFLLLYFAFQHKDKRWILGRKLGLSLLLLSTALIWYVVSSPLDNGIYWGTIMSSPLSWAQYKLGSAVGYFSIYYQYFPFFENYNILQVVVNILWQIIVFSLFVLFIFRWRHMYSRDKALFSVFSVCAFLYLIAPEKLGPLANPGQRLLYPMLFIMTGILAKDILLVKGKYMATCVAAIAVLIITIHLNILPVSQKMDDIYCDYSSLGLSKTDLYVVPEIGFEYESVDPAYPQPGFIRLLPMQYPLERLPYYLHLDSDQYTYGLFDTGIIRSQVATVQLLSADIIKEGEYSYQNVIITGYGPINQFIASLFPSNYEPLAKTEYFIYLKEFIDGK